jgi:UDP-glucose 4-epimerase
MSKILITGHKGNIGSRLATCFTDFIGIDTKEGKNLVTCDLPEDVDLIFHLGAHAPVEWSWNDPVRTIENLTSTVRLATQYPNAKIVFASTGASIDPASPYGFSKWACNEYLKKFHKNSVILYFPNIFGIPRSVVDIFKGREEVIIYGDGLQTRDYVHVDDIVSALYKAQDWEPGEYFCGSGIKTNLLQLAEGKKVHFKEARKEARESVLPNTTPNWKPTIKVLDYIMGYF